MEDNMKKFILIAALTIPSIGYADQAHAWRFWGKEYTHIGLDDRGEPTPCYDKYRFGFRIGDGCDSIMNPNQSTTASRTQPSTFNFQNISTEKGATITEIDDQTIRIQSLIISKDKATGGWRWECDDRSESGISPTKRDAKADGKAACGESFYIEQIILKAVAIDFEVKK